MTYSSSGVRAVVTCSCGARGEFVNPWGSSAITDHLEKFNQAHAICREIGATPRIKQAHKMKAEDA